jgi:DNA-binding PadR family transcriptional regulator
MAVRYAILGLLSNGPLHGYEIKRRFEQQLSFAWSLDFGQLYRHLAKLEAEGLVEQERVAQEGRPDRKVYHLTPAGDAEFRAWLLRPPESGWNLHNEFYLKLALWQPEMDRTQLLPLIDAQIETYHRHKAEGVAVAEEVRTLGPAGELMLLLVDIGRRHSEVELAWLEELRQWALQQP